MSAPARAREPGHIHLPSVHIRAEHGRDFDYEEDLYVSGRGRRRKVERVIRFVAIELNQPILIRETRDQLCPEDLARIEAALPVLMDEGDPETNAFMEACARAEFERQSRIAAGIERACERCGCSESRSCSGHCIWLTETLCSRCA